MIIRFAYLILVGLMSAQYAEIDIGYNRANGEFDKYNDDGLSIRFTYSKNFKNSNFLRWQASFQYISFYSDTWADCLSLGSGDCGPSIDVTNSENGYTIQGGLRFTPEKGLFGENSLFKPYATFNMGGIYLQEKTEYSDPDNFWDSWDCWLTTDPQCDNNYDYFNLDDIEDYRINFIYSIEFGFNFSFPKSKGYGLDMGLRYNMIPKIKKIEQYIPADDNIEANVLNFGSKIDADYMTFYIGVNLPFKNFSKNRGKLAFR